MLSVYSQKPFQSPPNPPFRVHDDSLMSQHTEEPALFMRLSHSYCGTEAAHHQRFIELDPACIASTGTLADTLVERYLVWHAIARLAVRRDGWLEFGGVVDGLQLEEVARTILKPRADKASIARWREGARALLEGAREEDLAEGWKCKVVTGGKDTHAAVRAAAIAAYGAQAGVNALPPQVEEWKPRATVVQRRVEWELAPELSIDRQMALLRSWCEEQLPGVSWHACIHRVRDARGAWSDTAHVVYTQYELAPERDEAGAPTGWWEFERTRRLPPPSPVIEVLWGKGPRRRMGIHELMRQWRTRMMELQDDHLEAMGFGRRYRTSADRPHGPADVSGTCRSPGADLGRGASRRLQTQVQTSNGTTGGNHSPGALRGEGRWNPAVPVEPNRVPARWLNRWRRSLDRSPCGQRAGLLAAGIVHRWSEEERELRVSDPEPEVRAMCAHALRWWREIDSWRVKVRMLCDGSPASREKAIRVERLVEALGVRGVALRGIAHRADRMELVEARQLGRAIREANDAMDAIATALDEKDVDAAMQKWVSRYARYGPIGDGYREIFQELMRAWTSMKKRIRPIEIRVGLNASGRTDLTRNGPMDEGVIRADGEESSSVTVEAGPHAR